MKKFNESNIDPRFNEQGEGNSMKSMHQVMMHSAGGLELKQWEDRINSTLQQIAISPYSKLIRVEFPQPGLAIIHYEVQTSFDFVIFEPKK